MKNKEFLKRLRTAAILQMKLNDAMKQIKEEFADCMDYGIEKILYGCYEKDGCLYDKDGEVLSKETSEGNLSEKHYVNQSCGILEDDYYGTLFYLVDNKGTVVQVSYQC
jgi:hypothetical protein